MKDVFIHFPVLETERCELVQIKEEDYLDLFTLFSDKRITQYLDGIEPFATMEDVRSFLDVFNQAYQNSFAVLWGVRLKKTTQIIGVIGIYEIEQKAKANLFYTLQPVYWNKGITTECVGEITVFSFTELFINRIETTVNEENTASQKVLLKSGYHNNISDNRYYINSNI
jgi:ribosomal-protein-alanine N-acetyltransferase